jgi:hypothetical protein
MGLIDDTEFSDISRIRKIRNTFGHHWKDIDFDRPEVADVARGLPWRGPTEYEATATVRSRFSAAVMLLLTDLLWRERLAAEGKTESEGVAEHHEFAGSTRMNPLQRFDFSCLDDATFREDAVCEEEVVATITRALS